jgi:hypothetical protein
MRAGFSWFDGQYPIQEQDALFEPWCEVSSGWGFHPEVGDKFGVHIP